MARHQVYSLCRHASQRAERQQLSTKAELTRIAVITLIISCVMLFSPAPLQNQSSINQVNKKTVFCFFKASWSNSLWRWWTGSAGTWSLARCGWMGLGTWAGLGGSGIPFKCSLSPLTLSGADDKKKTSNIRRPKMFTLSPATI